ncbi:hypothetical protein ARMGADRAFT_1086100 [Armillaria gallica]|uniref:Uncharacterized protein n=1 Tax=Armillaria gallica TaxID=47427 RepID=A0A2H3CVC5_ARMGA|nr:hypothetical protein ARMGADRAFT_1086100 [Armillaria gallica]
MAHLALYVLAKVEETGVWDVWSAGTYRQPSLNTSAKFNAIIPTLLSRTIRESLERFDCWGMAQVFWNNFSRCHHDASNLVLQLYEGNSEDTIEHHTDGGRSLYLPMCTLWVELSAHVTPVLNACHEVMNPSKTRSGTETPATIPEDEEAAGTKFLAEYNSSDPWGERRQEVLKTLVSRRGIFQPVRVVEIILDEFASKPSLLLAPATLCHIVPNYIGSNNKVAFVGYCEQLDHIRPP